MGQPHIFRPACMVAGPCSSGLGFGDKREATSLPGYKLLHRYADFRNRNTLVTPVALREVQRLCEAKFEEKSMSRSAFIGIAALTIFGATSAQGAMDCNALYKGALEKVHKEEIGGLEANRIADLHRLALRAYDACSAGDEFNARDFFDQLDKWRR